MTTGVPRSGGKNQHSDNVNMASNDGKFQNLPRNGNKTPGGEHANMPTNDGKMPPGVRGIPNSQYFYPPNMNVNDGMIHGPNRMAQPHYAPVPVTSMPPMNPSIYTNGGGPSSYFMPVPGNASTIPTPHNYGYPANNYQIPSYNGNGYFGQSTYTSYPAPHAQQPYAPQMNATPTEVTAITSGNPQRSQRERKPLAIVDPTTQSTIHIVPSKPSSTSTTPNTTVDADVKEEVKNAFRKDFSAQVQNKIENDKKETDGHGHVFPVAQSEPKNEFVLDDSTVESHDMPESKETAPDVTSTAKEEVEKNQPIPAVQESSDTSNLSKNSAEVLREVKVEESSASEKIVSENTFQPSKPDDEEVPLQAASADNEISTTASVKQVLEGEEEEILISPSPDQEEDKRIQEEEEEAERIRLREIELDNLLEELEKDSKECNENIGFYGRQFLYCVRDLEREFKRTEPPVPLDALKNTYGIDIQSMPKQTDKKRPDFNPSWLQNNSAQGSRKYSGRPSHEHRRGGGGGSKNKPFTGRPSIDRAPKVQLQNKAEHAWKSDKDKNNEDVDSEEIKLKNLMKAVRSLLNKITPTTKDDLIKEFLALRVSGEPPQFNAPDGQLAQVIDIIFDKAVDEPKFCSLYSEICKRQVDAELKFGKNSAFRNALLNRSQNTFVNKTMEANKTAIDNETDEEMKREMILKYEDDNNKFRRRKFGNITFIGQLYSQSLLSTKIIQWCLFDLLRHCHPDTQGNLPEPPYDEESIHCATQLVEAVGKNFESSKDFKGAKEYLTQIFDHMLRIADQCSPKIRFKIIGVKELRDNNWKQRKVVDQGPKKITEIHKEIQAEQQQLIMERDAYERKQSQGVRQGGNSIRRSAPPPSRNSLDSRASVQNKRVVATTASRLAPISAVAPRQLSLSNSGAPSKKPSWKTGSGGGGNNEVPGSRTIIQRNNTIREGGESRKNSVITERDAALQAAREIGGNPVNRSTSQISLVSQEDPERNEVENERQKKFEKVVTFVEGRFQELLQNDLSEKELIEEVLNLVNSEKCGKPELHNIFHQYSKAYIMMKPISRPSAAKILYKCLLKPETKNSVIKGIENYCLWATQIEAWEENANLWEILADLLVRVLLTHPMEGSPEDNNKNETKATTLDDFSPVFLAASNDDRPNKTYSLLILTLKQMAEQLAKESIDLIAGLSMDFQALSCCKDLDSVQLEAALKRCNPDVPDFDNLYDLVNH